ncbi:MAG: hypothetical protein WAK03_03045 [Methylocystis sp.]
MSNPWNIQRCSSGGFGERDGARSNGEETWTGLVVQIAGYFFPFVVLNANEPID